MKYYFIILKLAILLIIITHTAPAQNNATLQINGPQTFTLIQNQEKSFNIHLEELGLADILVLANDGLNLTMSILNPNGEYILEDASVSESFPFVAEKKGSYQITLKLNADEQNRNSGEQRITIQYTNTLNFADKMAVKDRRRINGY